MIRRYVPVVCCGTHDSPVDALLAMHVPHDEAMDAVAAFWAQGERAAAGDCILASLDGGRSVAAVYTAAGRWVAGNAYPDKACATQVGGERELARLVKRGRQGLVAHLSMAAAADGEQSFCPV